MAGRDDPPLTAQVCERQRASTRISMCMSMNMSISVGMRTRISRSMRMQDRKVLGQTPQHDRTA
eukprot:2041857-Alexandrium_andersonii.AAC.1